MTQVGRLIQDDPGFSTPFQTPLLPALEFLFTLPACNPQGADNQKYEEVAQISKLLTVIEEYLNDYNAQSKNRMDLVLFLYAAEHICRISRIIKQPYGNALLVGVSSPVPSNPPLDLLIPFCSRLGWRQRQTEPIQDRNLHE